MIVARHFICLAIGFPLLVASAFGGGEAAAAAYLPKLLEDNRRFEGEEIEPGTTLEEVEEFSVDGIADDATGLVLHGSFGASDFYATGVVFTVGRLRAGAGGTRADDGGVTAG